MSSLWRPLKAQIKRRGRIWTSPFGSTCKRSCPDSLSSWWLFSKFFEELYQSTIYLRPIQKDLDTMPISNSLSKDVVSFTSFWVFWSRVPCKQVVSGSRGIVSKYRALLTVNVEKKYTFTCEKQHSMKVCLPVIYSLPIQKMFTWTKFCNSPRAVMTSHHK